MELNMFH